MRLMLVIALVFSTTSGWASGRDNGRQDSFRRIRSVTFNVFCKFKGEAEAQYRKCFAGARFEKDVYWHGEEVEDRSDYPFNPEFEVECDGHLIHNTGGQRFTDEEGNRIQALSGPYPAIVFARGSLRDGRRAVSARLELFNDFSDNAYSGTCQIYVDHLIN